MQTPVPSPTQSAALRVVLLGASNLRLGFPKALSCLRRLTGEPLEVLGAFGHGRSYGAWSRVLWVRWLPGITQCGLWQEIERRQPLPTLALVTDIGNDLVYGEMPETIAGWVGTCLDRLERQGAEIVLTRLPIENLEFLSPLGYYVTRSILFPGRGVSRSALLERARDLDGRLREMGLARGARLVLPETSWYGIDPVHVRRGKRHEAWECVFSSWLESRPAREPQPQVRWRDLRGVRAAELRLLGKTIHTPQPAGRFDDGTTVALY
ncbi:MAG TPA: hypothetical protein VMW27_20990 [Thermoanaerobaculia bacterium]|nr:hypothetical protein [Thermoanaerobaculia bacterium]